MSEAEKVMAEHRRLAEELFARALGVTAVAASPNVVGNQEFLEFHVGRKAPVYNRALRIIQKKLPEDSLLQGQVSLRVEPKNFPRSLECEVLLGMIESSIRKVTRAEETQTTIVPFVSFPGNEDQLLTKHATHLVVGRRGVGKSTLLMKAIAVLKRTESLIVALDMQGYSTMNEAEVALEVLADIAREIATGLKTNDGTQSGLAAELNAYADGIDGQEIVMTKAPVALRRLIKKVTTAVGADLFVFLDDFHLIAAQWQPKVIHYVQAALKGAGGWLKIAGVRSFLNYWDASTREGLRMPGDAQTVLLDFTLEDPAAAERHLNTILETFLADVGVDQSTTVIRPDALRRLVWANAGVPRDFLQMFAIAMGHARKADRGKIVLSDANMAIGELGQTKMTDLDEDAPEERDALRLMVDRIKEFALKGKKTNAFLVRKESSEAYRCIQRLSDLRLLHLLHRTITPHKAGEIYEAYMLDYSLFTGFRRRRNISEAMPADGENFKASELRQFPTLPKELLDTTGTTQSVQS